MQLTLMRAKIHRATITEADLHYEGSVSIDLDILEKSGILPNEKVDFEDDEYRRKLHRLLLDIFPNQIDYILEMMPFLISNRFDHYLNQKN